MERLWKNAGATGRKRSERFKPRNGSTSQISFPPAATACPQNRMVRRGSTVRVRQRACTKCLLIQVLRRLRRKRLGRKIELRQSLRKLDHLVGKGRTHLVPL